MTEDKIHEILYKHEKWLRGEEGGERANFRCNDLKGANLRGANLRRAYLYGANLTRAVLYDAALQYAYLQDAALQNAALQNADLRGANLVGACLCKTDLQDANLAGANLTRADLRGANLVGAKLVGAVMYDADLRGADLDYSCLPLWCGSLTAHFDDRQLKQIAYHLVRAGLHSKNASPKTKRELAKLIDFANGFHRADECGKIKCEE